MCGSDIFLGLIAILFPPLAVWVKRGICSADSIINIALCCLGFLPGLLHAWYIIAKYPEPDYDLIPQDPEGGYGRRRAPNARVTYFYVQQQPRANRGGYQGYGTTTAPPPPQEPQGHHHVEVADGQPPRVIGGGNGEGASSGGQLPSYAEAVKGDHKVQTQD